MGKEENPTDYIWGVGPHLDDILSIEDFERHGLGVTTGSQTPTTLRKQEILEGTATVGEGMLDALENGAPDVARELLEHDKLLHPQDPVDVRNTRRDQDLT